MPDREIRLNEARLGGLMNLQRRWSGAGSVPEGRVVAFESLPSPDPRDENNPTPDHELGRALIRPHEALPLSRLPYPDTVGPKTIEPPPSRPRAAETESRQEDGSRAESCAIVFAGTKRQGQFRVVMLDDGGQRQSSRVRPHSVPRARAASVIVVVRRKPMISCSRGCWPLAGVQSPRRAIGTTSVSPGLRPLAIGLCERLLIICHDGNLTARFQAARFDELGNATVVAESAGFRAVQVRGSMKLARRAGKAHRALLERLEADGWQTTERTGPEWYARVLERPTGLRSV